MTHRILDLGVTRKTGRSPAIRRANSDHHL
jgi:hypothetical protein